MVTKVDNFFNVANFKNSIKAMVRPNYFVAELSGYGFKPFALLSPYEKGEKFPIDQTFKFRCEKAEFPGKTLATNEDIGGGGTTLKLPYDVVYNDIQLSIICSEDKKERMFFENWMNSIIGPAGYDYSQIRDGKTVYFSQGPGLVNYYEDYAKGVTLSVKQLNATANVIMDFVMSDVYPIAISPMNASWDETNSYQRFSVTLNYRYYTLFP
jgi:hypothetical protein